MAILTWFGADFAIRARSSNKHENNYPAEQLGSI